MYSANFVARGCTNANVHAVIQVDDTLDSLARMAINYPIPRTSEVLRATDETPVAQNWDTLVDPNGILRAPVSLGTGVSFWSGRDGSLQCNHWTSTAGKGNAGNATLVSAWMSQSNIDCFNINPHLLCICW